MLSEEARRKGSELSAIRSRERALAIYYDSPKICKFCNSIIKVQDGQKIADVRKKVFCDHHCSASYTNTKRERIKKQPVKYPCADCGKPVQKHHQRCRSCNIIINGSKLHKRTKGDLLDNRSGYQSYRSSIQKNARDVYYKSGKPLICLNCGYSKHTDVCHITSVAKFPISATIAEINDINNLLPLCPNCHWEFDNNLLDITSIGVAPIL
jgi:hypothetical protein